MVEGGAVLGASPHGCPSGTTVEVEDLFYNVPARKKFLRARQTETSRIFEICLRTALIRPELKLIVSSDGRSARQYLPVQSLLDRAYQAFGDVALEEIRSVGYKAAPYAEMAKRYDPHALRDGYNTMPDGERIFFISNPGLGLWATRDRLR